MDIRIVNTCNSNCLYCLEQTLRNKEKCISKTDIFSLINGFGEEEHINFYGGNPLLHPDLVDIIEYAHLPNKRSVSLLTNTYTLNREKLICLKKAGLTGIGFYFHTFTEEKHEDIVNGGIALKDLVSNIELIKQSGMYSKAIIHINALNIDTLARDIFILYKKFGVAIIDFVNYFPFDRPYDNYKDKLEYQVQHKRDKIDNLLSIIKKLQIDVKFVKFSRDFFGRFQEFYDFKQGVLEQIGVEDIERLNTKAPPFCYQESRCQYCFLKDKCDFYEL